MAERKLDVVLWGATGFVGQLTAERLAEHAARTPGFAWALAGRNLSKLRTLQAELTRQWPNVADVPLLQADSADEASLRAMTAQTEVVITTVGPYAIYGTPLVAACVATQTDYCDLTGEVQWMASTIKQFHDTAKASGTKIVHTCGFDSIPSDIGALLAAEAAQAKWGQPPEKMRLVVKAAKGGFSGGTVASMLHLLEQAARDRDLRRLLASPYALNPPGDRPKAERRDTLEVKTDPKTGLVLAPFVMAAVNTRVVRRSNALLGYPWGQELRYEEWMSTGKGLGGRVRAEALRAGMAAFVAAATAKPTRALLQKTVLPAPGEGPNRETIEHGYFETWTIAERGNSALVVKLRGQRDPGYGATASMLVASALVLRERRGQGEGGVLTPAVALGRALLPKLQPFGVAFAEPELL